MDKPWPYVPPARSRCLSFGCKCQPRFVSISSLPRPSTIIIATCILDLHTKTPSCSPFVFFSQENVAIEFQEGGRASTEWNIKRLCVSSNDWEQRQRLDLSPRKIWKLRAGSKWGDMNSSTYLARLSRDWKWIECFTPFLKYAVFFFYCASHILRTYYVVFGLGYTHTNIYIICGYLFDVWSSVMQVCKSAPWLFLSTTTCSIMPSPRRACCLNSINRALRSLFVVNIYQRTEQTRKITRVWIWS